ncbi:MAG: S-layer homology domain-containing protein [Oscillospiraceae bacterium]|nr:S-layer homology domain-containing protein [Oscillospiraceae bacterium]
MKKIITAVILSIYALSSTAYAAEFTDISGHWAEQTIISLADKGVVNGITAETFKPEGTVTRAEFLKMSMEAAGIETVELRRSECLDANSKDWFGGYLQSALDKGLIPSDMISNYSVDVVSKENSDGTITSKAIYNGAFTGNLPITREEMASLVQIMYQYSLNASTMKDLTEAADLEFTDNDSISSWAFSYVRLAYAQGFIEGMDDGSFSPKATATRAQAAVIISRVLEKIGE